MNKFAFWSRWDQPYRLTFKILSIILSIFLIATLIFQLGGFSYFYTWEMTGFLEDVLLPVFSNHSEFIESTINLKVKLLFQKVGGSFQILPVWLVYTYLGVVYVSLTGMLTIVSYLSRFWYITCMGLYVLIIAGLGFGRLGFVGMTGQVAIGAVAIPFIVLTYYFNSIHRELSLGIRFLLLLGLTICIGVLFTLTTPTTLPLLDLVYNTYWPALALSIVFILVVGHEIVYAILILTTRGSKEAESGNTLHFMVFSIVYLANVTLVYLRNVGYIDLDLYYMDVFLLLAISVILGIWGVKDREILYGRTLPFYPYVAYLYFSLAILTFATIVFISLSGNDSSLEVIEDAIVFGHLGFGGSFFVYILINFITLMLKNLPVHKVAFKEDNFPYTTSRLAGLVVVAAFFFASNYASLSQAVSGYFNGFGDMYLMKGKTETALSYYDRGSRYGNMLNQSNKNHKSNFMLGVMEINPEKAIRHFEDALARRPMEYTYASLGSAYESDNRFFEAMFTYQEGLRKFPNSWSIKNNLALLFNRTDVLDSTLFYFNSIDQSSWRNDIIKANLLAVGAKHGIPVDILSAKSSDRISMRSNLLAYQTTSGSIEKTNEVILQQSNVLNLFTYSYLNNLGLACLQNGDSTFLMIIDKYLEEPSNADFYLTLSVLKGANLYRYGKMSDAFGWMNKLRAESTELESITTVMMGKWAMELGKPYLANKYFELARETDYPWVTADLAQSYALTNNRSVARYILFDSYEKLDSVKFHTETKAMKALEAAINAKQVTWTNGSYSFDRERKQLQALRVHDTTTREYQAFGKRNPFYEEGVMTSVSFLNEASDKEAAYDVLLNAITINEFSEPLIKAYIEQCLEMGLLNYAESTILRLYDIMPLEGFQIYEQEYEKKKSQAILRLNSW